MTNIKFNLDYYYCTYIIFSHSQFLYIYIHIHAHAGMIILIQLPKVLCYEKFLLKRILQYVCTVCTRTVYSTYTARFRRTIGCTSRVTFGVPANY